MKKLSTFTLLMEHGVTGRLACPVYHACPERSRREQSRRDHTKSIFSPARRAGLLVPFIIKKSIIVAVIILPVVLGPALALGQTKRNPFAPLAKTTIRQIPGLTEPVDKDKDSEAVQLKLNGIIFSKNHPVAIINDTVVEIGSLIAGRRVSAISISQVELQYYDKKETLRITPKFLFTVSSKKQTQSDIQKRAWFNLGWQHQAQLGGWQPQAQLGDGKVPEAVQPSPK